MCGLAGILSSRPNKNMIHHITKMSASLVHRGPNSEGIWSINNVGFGHRRLSIVDLSNNGSQPMKSFCGRYVIAFNGEIYNHLELRDQLVREGVPQKWKGHSDTETLLSSISTWGLDEALCRSKGMFAFSLWDQKKNKLSLARDRMGEKPLYWGWAGEDFIFGSELKALRAHPECPKEICNEALTQYLRFKYIPAPRTIHKNIFKIEPGTILSIEGSPPIISSNKPIRPGESFGNLSIRRYWNLNREIENGFKNKILDFHEAIYMIDKTLSNAVDRQMISDVPLGAFLSGGIDSSTIVSLMQKQSLKPVKTFTIGFNQAKFDESYHAEKVAKYLGTNHTTLFLTERDAREVIPKLPSLYDEPFSDSSQIPTHLVCRAARQQVTVALSGDGGDELFGGYNRYIYGPKIWKFLSYIPRPLRSLIANNLQNLPLSFWDKIENIYEKISKKKKGIASFGDKISHLSERLPYIGNNYDMHFNLVSNWVNPERLLKIKVSEPLSMLNDSLPKFGLDDPAMLMMLQDLRSYLPDDILCKVDRAAMSVGLETRTPFLDPDVINLSLRLPLEMKINQGLGKFALRKVLNKYVPSKIIDRPKMGFAVPISSWVKGPLSNWAKDLLSEDSLKKDNIFDSKFVMRALKEHLTEKRDRSQQLWSILMFQAWKNEQS